MSIFFKCVIQKEFPLRRIKYVIGPDNWDRIYSPSQHNLYCFSEITWCLAWGKRKIRKRKRQPGNPPRVLHPFPFESLFLLM